MHPTLVVGVALLSWLAVRGWQDGSRVLLAGAGFVMGWDPASHGSRLGAFLVAVAIGATLSMLWPSVCHVLAHRLRRRTDRTPPH